VKQTPIRLPFGRTFLSWTPPDDLETTLVEKPRLDPLDDPGGELDRCLEDPLDSPPLEILARGAKRITIAITDATRPCPDRLIVSAIVKRLKRLEVPDEAITILVAIGMHRPSTIEEKLEKLGQEIVSRFRIVDSSPLEPALQKSLGVSPGGFPVTVDRRGADADLLIATGIVEPHQAAGYSGGWKTVAIGTGGPTTIAGLHGMKFLEHPKSRLGETDGNPFLETARWIGEKAGLKYCVNVALDPENRIVAVRSGYPESVHRNLIEWVRSHVTVPVSRKSRIVVGAAGYPKDTNIYQASRIPTYICFGRRPVIEDGGVIIVPAECAEGAGQGPGERLFFEWLSTSAGPDALLEKARREGYSAGAQRAVVLAWALGKARIAFVGSVCPGEVRSCGLESFETMGEAVSWARAVTGENRALIVPYALTTLPELTA
jgi:nickel-dependent lactate racemase